MKLKHSRRYREIKSKISNNKNYSLLDGLTFLQKNNPEKLKNIKVSFSLHWVNQKITLKSKIILPNPIILKGKIAVIKEDLPADNFLNILQKNENVEILTVSEVQQKVGGKKKSQWGFIKLLAHPNSETKIKTLEKMLAPKGIYPNKKNGFLTENILEEVEKFQKGEREIKNDKGGNIHAVIGEVGFSREQLKENYEILYNNITSLRPVGWKGDFLKKITLSTTMGPGLKILM